MGKGFSSPAQYRGDQIKTALIRNWRALVTFINTWVPTYESDGVSLVIAGDLTVPGDLTVQGTYTDSYGTYYVSSSAATTISNTTAHFKVAGTTTAGPLSQFTHTDNRLTYTGTPTQVFHVDVAISMTSASANQVIEFAIFKNGTLETGSEIQRKQGTATDVAALALDFMVSMATNDYVEVYVKNTTSATNVTADKMVVSIS